MTTTRPNLFRRALHEGRQQLGIWSTLASPYATELIAGAGYDWGLLDTEHTPSDVPLMLNQLQAAASATPLAGAAPMEPVVRPAWNDTVLIKRYLDIGARSLLLPFVQNADEAAAAVRATRYAPAGVRGMGGSTRASNFGRTAGYVQHAHDEICLLVQVETREALAQIEAIAAVDGIDGIFIGPADLSASMGYPGQQRHPEVDAAIDDAIVRIRRAGKAPGILMADAARARACLDLGAQFVAVAMDLLVLRNGVDGIAAQWRRGEGATTSTSASPPVSTGRNDAY